MIRLIDAEKIYDNGTHALKGVSFTVDDGEFVFLVGPSGSGKSTIIKLLTGEVVPTSGRVMVNGFSMSRIADRQLPYMISALLPTRPSATIWHWPCAPWARRPVS